MNARHRATNRAVCLAAAAVLLVGGCAKYYQVHDPSSGKTYYTTKLDEKRGGAVTLKDGRTGADVTVQNSEVQSISKEQYDMGRANSGRAPQPAMAESSAPTKAGATAAPAAASVAAARANTAASLRQELNASKEQIDRTLASLNELAEPGQADLKGAYKRYSENVDLLDRQAQRARMDADSMRQARAQYFSQWQATMAETDNPTLRQAAADRRARLRAGEERIVTAAGDLKESYDPFMRDLQDVRKFLADDLSADRASILGPLAKKSNQSGATVKHKIDALIAEVDAVEGPAAQQPTGAAQPAGAAPGSAGGAGQSNP
jgi:hypothetical protein